MWHEIYLIKNSFWKIYEVRFERGDFNWCRFWAFWVCTYFDTVGVEVKTFLLLFRLALAILWSITGRSIFLRKRIKIISNLDWRIISSIKPKYDGYICNLYFNFSNNLVIETKFCKNPYVQYFPFLNGVIKGKSQSDIRQWFKAHTNN